MSNTLKKEKESFSDVPRKISLSEDRIKNLSRISVVKSLTAIAFDWCVIASVLVLANTFKNPIVWFAGAIIIAGRQHALLVLMHDAVHYRLFPSRKWNEWVSDVFLAFPLFVCTNGFRKDHLPHHQFVFTENDPEWARKKVQPEWRFPMKERSLLKLIVADLFGMSTLKMFRMLRNFSGQKTATVSLFQKLTRPLFYALVLSPALYFGLWIHLLFLWVVPAFTILFAILRIRNIAEHSGVPLTHTLNMSRDVVAPKWWERALFAPHHVNLHLCHHLYPSVPCYNLPKLRKELLKHAVFEEDALTADHYLFGTDTVLKMVTSRKRSPKI